MNYMEKVNHTFKGDGSFPTPEAGVNWQVGFEHGYQYGMKVIKIGKGYDPFPGNSNKGWFGNGFAEGVNSAYSFILHRDYPNFNSVIYDKNTGITTITLKDGRDIRLSEKGKKISSPWWKRIFTFKTNGI